MAEEDRIRLNEMLDDAAAVLTDIVQHPAGLLPRDLHPYYQEALEEAMSSLRLVQEELLRSDYDSALSAVGLTGSSLNLKAAGFSRTLRRGGRRPGGRRRGVVKSILRWLNVWLGSLASIIPAGDALKEFKDSIEAGIEDVEAEEDGTLL